MKSMEKGIPAISMPTKKDSTSINLTAGLNFGENKSKRTGIAPALPKK